MSEWTIVWPTKSGLYWFYGWCWRDRDDAPKMHLVRVAKTSNSVAYIANGHFLYKEEGGYGKWSPAVLPKPPVLEEVRDE